MRVRVFDRETGRYFKSEVYAVINIGYYEKQLVLVPEEKGDHFRLFDCLDKTEKIPRVLINRIMEHCPDEWIFKRSERDHDTLKPYRSLLKPGILFYAYRGFTWLLEDTDTMVRLLNGEKVPVKGSKFENRLYSDLTQQQWKYIESQEDADAFMAEVCGFHDSVIKELYYSSGAWVDEEKNMYPDTGAKRLSVEIHSQQCRNFEMVFEGVTALNLRPPGDNYSAEIFEASVIVKDASVYFCDSFTEDVDLSDTGTWITAYSMKWRFI